MVPSSAQVARLSAVSSNDMLWIGDLCAAICRTCVKQGFCENDGGVFSSDNSSTDVVKPCVQPVGSTCNIAVCRMHFPDSGRRVCSHLIALVVQQVHRSRRCAQRQHLLSIRLRYLGPTGKGIIDAICRCSTCSNTQILHFPYSLSHLYPTESPQHLVRDGQAGRGGGRQ